jgi:DNA polymerase II large subunit
MKNIGSSEAPQEAVEDLRKALVDVSDFVSFCRVVRKEPSKAIQEILVLRENQATDNPPLTQEKMHRLGTMVSDVQNHQREAAMVTVKMESKLNALRSEYDRLLHGLKKKNELTEN